MKKDRLIQNLFEKYVAHAKGAVDHAVVSYDGDLVVPDFMFLFLIDRFIWPVELDVFGMSDIDCYLKHFDNGEKERLIQFRKTVIYAFKHVYQDVKYFPSFKMAIQKYIDIYCSGLSKYRRINDPWEPAW